MKQDSIFVPRKLLSGYLSQIGRLTVAVMASFFLMPFLVHHMGDREYGFWSIAWAVIGYYSLLDLGLSSAVSQYVSIAIGRKQTAECRSIFNTALRIQTTLGGAALLVTALIAIATPWFCHSTTEVAQFRRVITLLGLGSALEFPLKAYVGILEATLRFDLQALSEILRIALRTGLLFSAILAGGGLIEMAWMSFLSALPMCALVVWFARREAEWARIDWNRTEWRKVTSFFSYSIYTFVASLADLVRFQIDPLVISGLIGLEAVTHYKIASVFAHYYLVLIASIGVLRPLMSRLQGSENRSGLEKTVFFGTKISVCASIFLGFALISWGKPFIIRWMGMPYEDAYLPLVALSLAVLLDVSQKPSIDLLYATFKHRFYTYMNWAEGALNLVFSLALARPFGIFGVALGTLLGAVVIRAILQPWWVCKVTAINYVEYLRFLQRNVVRCALTMAVAIAVSSWGLRPSYPWLMASAGCATVLYAAGSWFLVFSRREREYLLEGIRDRRRDPIHQPPLAEAL